MVTASEQSARYQAFQRMSDAEVRTAYPQLNQYEINRIRESPNQGYRIPVMTVQQAQEVFPDLPREQQLEAAKSATGLNPLGQPYATQQAVAKAKAEGRVPAVLEKPYEQLSVREKRTVQRLVPELADIGVVSLKETPSLVRPGFVSERQVYVLSSESAASLGLKGESITGSVAFRDYGLVTAKVGKFYIVVEKERYEKKVSELERAKERGVVESKVLVKDLKPVDLELASQMDIKATTFRQDFENRQKFVEQELQKKQVLVGAVFTPGIVEPKEKMLYGLLPGEIETQKTILPTYKQFGEFFGGKGAYSSYEAGGKGVIAGLIEFPRGLELLVRGLVTKPAETGIGVAEGYYEMFGYAASKLSKGITGFKEALQEAGTFQGSKTIGTLVGQTAFLGGLGRVIPRAVAEFKVLGKKYVPPETKFNISSLEKARENIAEFPQSPKGIGQMLEKFEKGSQESGLLDLESKAVGTHTTARGAFKSITETPEKASRPSDVAGLYITPVGEASVPFTGLLSREYPGISINPLDFFKRKSPAVLDIKLPEPVQRMPESYTSALTKAQSFFEEPIGKKGSAYITAASEVLGKKETEAAIIRNTVLERQLSAKANAWDKLTGFEQYTRLEKGGYPIQLNVYKALGEEVVAGKKTVLAGELVEKTLREAESLGKTNLLIIPLISSKPGRTARSELLKVEVPEVSVPKSSSISVSSSILVSSSVSGISDISKLSSLVSGFSSSSMVSGISSGLSSVGESIVGKSSNLRELSSKVSNVSSRLSNLVSHSIVRSWFDYLKYSSSTRSYVKIPPPPPPIFYREDKDEEDFEKKVKNLPGFAVLLKKSKLAKKYDILLGEGLALESALELGRRYAAGTAKASFKVIPSALPGRQVLQFETGKFQQQFYKSKIGAFVERTKFRIDLPGEKKEIPGRALELRQLGLIKKRRR